MNDYVFYFVGICFFFILWVYSGGPNNPISFSGPYITPITDVDSTQIGYDDGSSVWSAWHGDTTKLGHVDVSSDARSPYAGSVEIVGSHPEEHDAGREYLMIRSSESVTITGWQLASAQTGTQVRIPEGSRNGRSGSVRLSDGDEAVIITGTRSSSELKGSFPDIWNVYLGKRSDLWDDDRDTITLLDQNGKVVDQYSY